MVILIILFWLAVLAMLAVFPMLAAWLTRHRPLDQQLGATGCGCLLGAAVMSTAFWFALCYPPAGQGAVADKGRSIAAPVIAALEVYHARVGSYPVSLRDLAFTDSTAVYRLLGDTLGRRSWGYRATAQGYELEFSYTGPGMNFCFYRGGTEPKWRCGGYY
jgi:hypothetical protein